MRLPGDLRWQDFFAALMVYAVALVYQGYQYGQGDQSQILPVIYSADHPGSYANDHYVQHYLRSDVNERTIFQALLRYLGYDIPVVVFLWHAFFTVLLLLAWIAIARLYMHFHWLWWIGLALLLTMGYHTATGSNEIYYNQLVPSLPAKALSSWAIYWWLTSRYTQWVVLLALAGYLQPLVGLQVFILTAGGLIMDKFFSAKSKEIPWKKMLIYGLMTIPWLYFLARHNGAHEDPQRFVEVLYFRLPHHFFSATFGWIHITLFAIFSLLCLLTFKGKVRWFVFVALLGTLVYTVAAEGFGSTLVLYTQWWKTSIWIEAFAFMALMIFLEKSKRWRITSYRPAFILLTGILIGTILYRFSGIRKHQVPYMIPLTNWSSPEVDISMKAKQYTPDTSLFIIPPEITAFRWYSKRSNYIDYKAMLHNEDFLYDLYARLGEIYDYDMEAKSKGENIFSMALHTMRLAGEDDIQKWKSLGITHVITYAQAPLPLVLLAGNNHYLIYRIP